jgi:single-strand DNA-binding protein
MAGVNKAILIGNLGKDPELRYTPGGQPTSSFSLATTDRWTDRNGQKQERTEWHNIVAWGKLAELVNQYLKKGRSAYVEGRIATRSWDDRDGNKKYRTEIIASQIQFLGGPGQTGGDAVPDAPESVSKTGAESAADQGQGAVVEENLPF